MHKVSHSSDQDDQNASLLAFDQYMRWVRWTPELSPEEEQRLLVRIEHGRFEQQQLRPDAQVLALAGAARDRLVEGYQALVISIANRYKRCFRSMELLDLIQEGNLGLLKAIERSSASEGTSFCATAAAWIRGSILTAYSERDALIRMAHRTFVHLQHLRQVMTTLDCEPTPADLAAAMHISPAKVDELLLYERQNGVASLQTLLGDGIDESQFGFASVFACSDEGDAPRRQYLQQVVQQAIETALTPRQQQSIRYRFGLHAYDGTCYSAVERAQLMGLAAISQSVEQAEQRAKKRLRVALAPLYGLVEAVPARVKKPRPSLVPPVHERDYYTIREACQVLQLSYPTVRERMKRGVVPYEAPVGEVVKYRFPKEAIETLALQTHPKNKREWCDDKAV